MQINWTVITSDILISLELDKFLITIQDYDGADAAWKFYKEIDQKKDWSKEQIECTKFVYLVLSMTLNASNPNEPYGTSMSCNIPTPIVPEAFPKGFLSTLITWINSLKNLELRARLYDLLWLVDRKFEYVKNAVADYIAVAIQKEDQLSWPKCVVMLERGLRLALSLGAKQVEFKRDVIFQINEILNKYKGEDESYLTYQLATLILNSDPKSNDSIPQYLKTAAKNSELIKNYFQAKDYYDLLGRFYKGLKNTNLSKVYLLQASECLVSHVEMLSLQKSSNALVKARLLSEAIIAMRKIEGTKLRVKELHKQLLKIQEDSHKDFITYHSEKIDVTNLAQEALNQINTDDFYIAIIQFCTLFNSPSINDLKAQSLSNFNSNSLGNIFSNIVVNGRGRVVAKVPAFDSCDTNDLSLSNDRLVFDMYKTASSKRELLTHAVINPVRLELQRKFSINRDMLFNLLQNSPWIPPGHYESIITALLAGFQGDLIVVAHIVPFQIEAIVRHAIEQQGYTTSSLNNDELQPERSLNLLLETAEADEVFGQNQVFELTDLFTSNLGKNLRNEVAHCLLDDQRLFQSDFLYSWWLLLKLCAFDSFKPKSTNCEMAS